MQYNPIILIRNLGFLFMLAIQPTAAIAQSNVNAKPASKAPASATTKSTASAPALKGAVLLNQKDIHTAYNEGDFDKVISLIKDFNAANKTYSRADSIFVAKHLAVVHSANPETREKGRYYMYRMLELMPSAELVDMFVSDEIDRIFDKVRKEFVSRQKSFGVDSTQLSMPEKPATGTSSYAATGPSSEFLAATKEDNEPYWKRNGFWIAGGLGLAVAGTTAYFLYTSDEPTGKTIVIPNETSARK